MRVSALAGAACIACIVSSGFAQVQWPTPHLKPNTPEDVPVRSRSPILVRLSPSDMFRKLDQRISEAGMLLDGLDDTEVQFLRHPLFCTGLAMFVPGPTCKSAFVPGPARDACMSTEQAIIDHSETIRRKEQSYFVATLISSSAAKILCLPCATHWKSQVHVWDKAS